ncbi:TonB-dependent receptor [Alteromonas sediminis]|uniref:TonB-dependent receptor n=1 Tax=Alteromonas sediminis TaxID=2259342 RepID=A0A3N5Y1N8_9ALTE|nr:TonB-dependent receptor [Alteromonas sediminis]RPJ66466.1 TonB-dependent receptor [Alteromonas sediminis]
MTRRYNKLALSIRVACIAAISAGTPVYAQDQAQDQQLAAEQSVEKIMVTGSRIRNADFAANSPLVTVDAEQLNSRADITLDTYLNTLPQVNPAGTTTSNNPGNGAQSNIDLRGLGANRNLVLVDGRRVMVSASNMTVDLNTIPAALIDSVEVITGGAGAAYGADAVAGAVNIKLKNDFEGFDFTYNRSESEEFGDSKEYSYSGLLGGNFDDDKGNAVLSFDYTVRDGLIKGQRPFAAVATATTTFFPEGRFVGSGSNPITQSAVDDLFATYGVAPGSVPANFGLLAFNDDGSLFSAGIFNTDFNVENWRYPVDLAVNTNLFPDRYSYNFDAVNILVLPLERRSFSTKMNYFITDQLEIFGSAGWTNYESSTALAPTPFPLGRFDGPGANNPNNAVSQFVEAGSSISNALVVPVSNPFLPDDFRMLLNSRTGDDPRLVGSGADEAFLVRQRSLWNGLRQSFRDNTILQYMIGARGTIQDRWDWEVYAMQGETTIRQTQTGNLQNQRLVNLVEAPDGGVSICEGGYNPFGRNPVSQECADYINISATTSTVLDQQIVQGYITGDVFELPAGAVSVVVGAENRKFEYAFDPGATSGSISGFNTSVPAGGTNEFTDLFFEAFIPLVDGEEFAESLDLTLGFRTSESQFTDIATQSISDKDRNSAYKAELSWHINDDLPRIRASFQRSVRAPNFGELFDGGSSAPQYFDPCSRTTNFRTSGGESAAGICADNGVADPSIYVQTPGGQVTIFTSGNSELKAEEADTLTLGAVYTMDNGVEMSLDYYSIDIDGAIQTPNVNLIIADCFNYYGRNPDLDINFENCQGLARGGDIFFISAPTASGSFPTINGGTLSTSGFDFQSNYAFDTEWLGGASFNVNLFVNYLLEFENQQAPFLPALDYAGTVSYFGAGLGTTFPELKANLNLSMDLEDVSVNLQGRYVAGMDHRLEKEFPGEQFPGTGSVMYWDASATYFVNESISLRLGVNNLFNKLPPLYSPNVQSGTDPSQYDVVGRRLTFTARMTF